MERPLEQDSIRTYMRGMCHVHALAAVRLHGGAFAIARDENFGAVIHVWSIHETNDGPVARDVLGDRLASDAVLYDSLRDFFPQYAAGIEAGDVTLAYPVSAGVLGCEMHLADYSESDIQAAIRLDSVARPLVIDMSSECSLDESFCP